MLSLYLYKFFEPLLDLLKINIVCDSRYSTLDNLYLKYFILDLTLKFLFF